MELRGNWQGFFQKFKGEKIPHTHAQKFKFPLNITNYPRKLSATQKTMIFYRIKLPEKKKLPTWQFLSINRNLRKNFKIGYQDTYPGVNNTLKWFIQLQMGTFIKPRISIFRSFVSCTDVSSNNNLSKMVCHYFPERTNNTKNTINLTKGEKFIKHFIPTQENLPRNEKDQRVKHCFSSTPV